MRKYTILIILFATFLLNGCHQPNVSEEGGRMELSGSKPPDVYIHVGHEIYDTILGTYCWGSECVETADPVEMLSDEKPIIVKAGEMVTIEMDFQPLPNKVYLEQFRNNTGFHMTMNDHTFQAPEEKGIYYYSYGVSWMDEKIEKLTHGDAFYSFALEVK